MTYYIAGPMRFHREFNFPAFDSARDMLLARGNGVISPADIDRAHGFDPTGKTGFEELDRSWFVEVVKRDIDAVFQSDALYVLRGWQDSRGARAELALAEWLGKKVEFEPESVLDEAKRITGGARRRDYDDARTNFRRIATLWNAYDEIKPVPNSPDNELDVAYKMAFVKVAREMKSPKRDNHVDFLGYGRLAAQVQGFEEV